MMPYATSSCYPTAKQWAFAAAVVAGGMSATAAYDEVYGSRSPRGRTRQVSWNLASRLLRSQGVRQAMAEVREALARDGAMAPSFPRAAVLDFVRERLRAEAVLRDQRLGERMERRRKGQAARLAALRARPRRETSRQKAWEIFWAAEAAIEKGKIGARVIDAVVRPVSLPETRPTVPPAAVLVAGEKEVQPVVCAPRPRAQGARSARAAVDSALAASSAPCGHWEERFVPGHFPPRRLRRWVEDNGDSNV
jgi:hypothetical protein